MSELVLEIKPKEGLGSIKFGEIPENVTKIIGTVEPIVSHFDLDNKNATLFGEKVFDMNEDAITQLMNKHGYVEIEKEEEEWGELRLTFDDAMIDFYFIEGELAAVNWGVIINDDGLKN